MYLGVLRSSMASIKLVAIAKDEAAYLPEWIYHHLSIGIQEIDVYLNGITDNSYRLMRLINAKHKNVKFYNADHLVGISIRSKRSFQQVVYRFAWSTEKYRKNVSHLAFLDIDEYLISSSFGSKINTMFNSAGKFDILSNVWYTDLPSEIEPFARFFCESQMVQKMSIIKSIGRLKSNVGHPMVHNFKGVQRKPDKINARMSDGCPIKYSGLGKRLSQEDADRSIDSIEPWFVFHRVYRSHDEYCASLMRGRKHRSNDAPIKDNRNGYIAMEDNKRVIGSPMQYSINPKICRDYQKGFNCFISDCDLAGEIEKGRNFVRNKYKELEKLLTDNPELLNQYNNVFRGTVFSNHLS